ncbi:MAG: outer membrane beta-barrel family protein [Pseudoflavonifractor sp.]|nr:outer membrane beta-barrel family protein [Pseudoflavonifractor sp.]
MAACPLWADGLDRFMLRAYLFEKDTYERVDSVTMTLSVSDTIPASYTLLRGNDSLRLITGGELRALVNGGLGSYTAVFEKEGYEPLVTRFKIASVSEDVKILHALHMERERRRALSEVTVTATRIKMVMKGDTMVFDASAFDLGEGSMLETLVEQLPGATLSEEGLIKVNGRPVNELLVNGKDFFKGDPKVALQNLPAYTVKNIKVYDKASDDAYLTHSDARLTRREEDENLVMDIVLKKEYTTGRMANVEAGYGTDHRYIGRAFGLLYSSKFRVTLFGNANNIGDRTQGSSSGHWVGSSSTENGENHIVRAGLDYAFDNEMKLKVNGNATYSGEKNTNNDIAAVTSFYPTGDIFTRSRSHSTQRNHSVISRHDLRIARDNYFLSINPSLNWNHGLNRGDTRRATFSHDPFDAYRGAVIDSIFAARASGSFDRYMLTRLQTLSASASDNILGSLGANATIRPRSWKGQLTLRANATLSRSERDVLTLYDQALGEASTSTDPPLTQTRFNNSDNNRRNLNSGINYKRDIRRFGPRRTNNISYSLGASYIHSSTSGNNSLFMADSLPRPLSPPSASRLPWLIFNPANSRHTSSGTNDLGASLRLSFNSEPTAPGDSTINPAFNISLNLSYTHRAERYLLHPMDMETRMRASRATDFLFPSLYIYLASNNSLRNITGTLSYSLRPSAPSISHLIDYTNTTDPLNIYDGNPGGLHNEKHHELSATLTRYSRANQSYLNFSANWRVSVNSIAYARRYDASTGVTLHRPENISGNWEAQAAANYARSFGPKKQWEASANINYEIGNSADYSSDNTAIPTRSSVLSQLVRPSVNITCRIPSGSSLTIGFQTVIASQHSARQGFNNMTWREYWPYLRAFIKMPWKMELNTQFNPYLRRGYSDKSMNTSEYVWNATLAKTFSRPGLTVKLVAHDILGSAKHVYTSVNAQGHSETWRSTMPRYVMATLAYRLDLKPRSSKH